MLPNEFETLILSVYVNDETASELNMSLKPLEDILILHTERGKDHFVTINATYRTHNTLTHSRSGLTFACNSADLLRQ